MQHKRSINFGFESVSIERRTSDGATTLEGLAIPYDQWSQPIYGYFKEKFEPRAFSDNLQANPDIVCTCDHKWEKLLGRTSSRTLTLTESDAGIAIVCKLPNTSYARDLAEMVDRKDIRGMSFTFDSVDEVWGKADGMMSRSIKRAKLYEVCFTANPAYLQTTASLRSLNVYDLEDLKRLHEKPVGTPIADSARSKMAALLEHV